ncbi:MAG TPA: Mur ligase family protein, partial [Chloroflexota bacterium]|nr:Mur ligase family protein [Chloroflexota bacterium]
AGMNALAALLLIRGCVVSGSDQQTSAQVERLVGQGMTFFRGHDPAQVAGADLVIISAAVREHNPELAAARSAGAPVVKRAEALGWLLADARVIAVAGTHGKTTTSAMLAVILSHAGLQPTFVVGGEVLDLGASAAAGAGEWAVVEADEYDRSFLHLRPTIALITNVEPDHLEYYGSVEAMHEAYHQFIARIIPGGVLVRNHDDPFLRALVGSPDRELIDCAVDGAPSPPATAGSVPAIRTQPTGVSRFLRTSGSVKLKPRHLWRGGSFAHLAVAFRPLLLRLRKTRSGWPGTEWAKARASRANEAPRPEGRGFKRAHPRLASYPAPWYASAIHEDSRGSHFLLQYPGGGACPVDLPISGRHNISNAVQALAAAAQIGVSPETAAAALSRFRGTGRRFQLVGESGGIVVIDDYAHHPTEVRATLAAARARYPDRRLVTIFQPHTYSRTVLLFDQFVTAFDGADELIVSAIHAARETDTLGMDSGRLVDAIRTHPGSPPTEYLPDLPAITAALDSRLRPGDLVLTLGAGSITELGPKLLVELSRNHDALEK